MIKDKYFRVCLVVTIVLLLAIFAGCNPYKKIVTDPNITPKNKELLSQTCERYFPPEQPKFIKGETVIKIDTFKSTDTLTIIDTFNNTTTKYVTKTNTVTVEKLRTDTVVVTNKYEIYRLNAIISAQGTELIKNEIEIKNLKEENKHFKIIGGVCLGLIVLILGIYAVIKFKF